MRSLIILLIVLLSAIFARTASAQEPDIREIRPAVMLLVDSSGSMNYDIRSGSTPTTSFAPTCTGNATAPGSTRSRWTAMVEALTGTFSEYYCTTINRRIYRGAADQYYHMPHYAPGGVQMTNGILDAYRDRVKFGMMTLDPVYGIMNARPESLSYLVPDSTYWARINSITGPDGEYSYGTARPISFPGCTERYLVNGGARRAARTGETVIGGLISVGADSSDHLTTNSQVQTALLSIRPYGGSTLDALIDDFQEWITTDNDVVRGSDPLAACRNRYAILISDGEGDDLYRRIGCDTPGSVCPYARSSDTVSELCAYNGTECTGVLDGFYTVGFSVSSPAGAAFLDDLASRGGTASSLRADNVDELLESLSDVLDATASGTTTRTTTAYISSSSTYSGSDVAAEYEFTSGFRVGNTRTPWTGILDRTRYTCTGPRTPPNREPLDPSRDSFHTILNNRDLTMAPRNLITAVTADPADSRGVVIGDVNPGLSLPRSATGSTRRSMGVGFTPVTIANPVITAGHFNITTGSPADRATRRTSVIDWLHGASRPDARLGDIYHSSPQVQVPPRADIADEWFNAWRRRADIIDRPSVVYVGTNDGIMHAFASERYMTLDGRIYTSGEELWGFIPPAVLGNISTAMVSHQALVDGTPVIRNVFFRRTPGGIPNNRSYHTVLVAGLRGGGPYYFALDVSDPLDPQFLWQFTRSDMGPALGRPGIGQVLMNVEGVLQIRSVAIFGGGGGTLAAVPRGRGWGGCSVPPGALQARFPAAASGRTTRNCWIDNLGMSFYVVDVATGEVIRSFGSDVLAAPMTGGVSLFPGDTGMVANRAYTTDSAGVLWRLDMSSTNPANWSMSPVHDLYWSDDPADGADSQEPPIVSVDDRGEVVVVVGTGNMDDLEGRELYRVVSVTDRIVYSSRGFTYNPTLNWEIRLQPGEQVTGPMVLFDSKVYFNTFLSTDSATDLCAYGGSRMWGVHYLETSTSTPPAGYTSTAGVAFPRPMLEETPGSGVFNRYYSDIAPNTIAVGVSVAAAPTCLVGDTTADPYLGTRYHVTESSPATFRLVSQVSGAGSTLAGRTSVGTVSIGLPTLDSYTRILNYAANADY